MSALAAIPFVVFLLCCFLQFPMLHSLKNALIERHPDFYLDLAHASWSADQSLVWFTLRGDHRDLNDPRVTAAVIRFRLLWLAAGLSMVAVPVLGAWLSSQ
jgi:hypothetical protein